MNPPFKQIYLIAIFAGVLLSCNQGQKQKPLTKIAFGSCAKQWMPQPIWKDIAAQDPDLFLFLGDAIYGDWNDTNVFEVSPSTLDRDYAKLAAIPEFTAFRKDTPILATWDNHDYGSHNGGAEFKHKELAKQKFLDFFGEYQESIRRHTPGIYDSKTYGPDGKRVQLILLDTRWFKSPFKMDTLNADQRTANGKVGKYIPNTDSAATLLGETQWKWLEEQMQIPAQVRLICSSTQVIPNEKGMDEWGDYPLDRTRLLDLISSSDGYSLILSGNVHFGEFSKMNWKDKEIREFTSSGLTHFNQSYANAKNTYRVGEPCIDLNFGMVKIDWQDHRISMQLLGNNTQLFEQQIEF